MERADDILKCEWNVSRVGSCLDSWLFSSGLVGWLVVLSLLSFPESVTISGIHACLCIYGLPVLLTLHLVPRPATLEIPPQLQPAESTWPSWESGFRQCLPQLKVPISGTSLLLSRQTCVCLDPVPEWPWLALPFLPHWDVACLEFHVMPAWRRRHALKPCTANTSSCL